MTSDTSYGDIVDVLARSDKMNVHGPMALNQSPQRGRSCLAFTEAEDHAFAYLRKDMQEQLHRLGCTKGAEYAIDTDAVGNMFITYYGEDRSSTVLYHSHLDSVPDGGPLDGVWGVQIARDLLLKLATFRKETGTLSTKSLTVAVWRGEESSMTGRACVGSAIATGELTPEKLHDMTYGKNGKDAYLREHWKKTYGDTRPWEAVLDEAAHPLIRDNGEGKGMLEIALPSGTMTIAMTEEAHIAQALMLQQTENDVHIARGGIGGSIREDFVLDAKDITTSSLEVGDGQYTIFDITVIGEEAHTGGTVHNQNETMTEGGTWFRNDALVGTYILFKELFDKGNKNKGVRVLGTTPDELTGYTKVPRSQSVQLLIKTQNAADFQRTALESCRATLRATRNLDMQWTSTTALKGNRQVLDTEKAIGLLSIPARAEGAARRTDQPEDGIPRIIFGVTSTGTDFVLKPETGFSMKLDFRFTDMSHLTRLRKDFETKVQTRVLDRHFTGKTLDDTRTERSRSASARVSDRLADTKKKIAKCLGYDVLEGSVLPGHDSGTLAKARQNSGEAHEGTQISMTIAKDNGCSHNPREAASTSALRKAQLVSQIAVMQCLGISDEARAKEFEGRLMMSPSS